MRAVTGEFEGPVFQFVKLLELRKVLGIGRLKVGGRNLIVRFADVSFARA